MIVLDNIIFSLQRAGGISVFWQQLISNLLKTSEDIRYIEYESSDCNLFRQRLDIPESSIIKKKLNSKLIAQFLHPRINIKEKFIFHSSYFRTCSLKNAINVTTVHDFIYQQSKMTLKQRIRTELNVQAIKNSDAVVCVSENTKRDLMKYVPDVDPSRVHIIYNGVSEDFRVIDETPYPDLKGHILYVGGRQSYKNFPFLIDCIKDTEFHLLICGSELSNEETALLDEHLPGRYKQIIFPDNEELNKVYNSVYALAYPSSYEGFGIPVIEAQRSGCPVIALDASSIPEIISDHSLLI